MALIRSNLGSSFRSVQAELKAAHEGAVMDNAPRKSLAAGRLAALRDTLAKIEGKTVQGSQASTDGKTTASGSKTVESKTTNERMREPSALSLGIAEVDRCLPGKGLAPGAVHEVIAAAHGDRPACLGFSLALMALAGRARMGSPVIVASRASLWDFGPLYGHGLHQMGVNAGSLILIEARSDKEALWAIEETLRSGAGLSMVLGLVGSGARAAGKAGTQDKRSALADLTLSRRLSLAAASTRTPLVLCLPPTAGETSAAATRWRISAAPAWPRSSALRCNQNSEASFRRSRWRAGLERCRNGRTGNWLFEWDHVALRFHLAKELACDAPAQRRPESNGESNAEVIGLRRLFA
ncbi:MAG: hypothetical protein WC807_04930 [Hyphomicrobium sp.]|jgi:protein ImuA